MILKDNFKVIITDLDGTLLNSNHKISSYTKTVFQELHRLNFIIIVATGRHHLDAKPLVSGLDVPLYLVTSNGARIHSPENELIFSFDMESDTVKSILSLEIDDEITTVLFKENVWQTNKNNEKLNEFQPEVNYHPELVDFKTLVDFSAIKVFFTHHDHQKLLVLRNQILEKHAGIFNHAFSLPFCLEFMDKEVDKSYAIAKILEIEKTTFEQSVSFGDGFNDEKMLKATGKSLIMANAPQSLKNQLPHLEIILSNNEDGVAKYLFENIILKCKKLNQKTTN